MEQVLSLTRYERKCHHCSPCNTEMENMLFFQLCTLESVFGCFMLQRARQNTHRCLIKGPLWHWTKQHVTLSGNIITNTHTTSANPTIQLIPLNPASSDTVAFSDSFSGTAAGKLGLSAVRRGEELSSKQRREAGDRSEAGIVWRERSQSYIYVTC